MRNSWRRRTRRNSRFGDSSLDVTPFMNLMVVLIPFLLSGMVFSRLAVLELNLPTAPDTEKVSKPAKKPFSLIVTLHPDHLTVQGTGLKRTNIPSKGKKYDLKRVRELLEKVKSSFPNEKSIILLSEPSVSYESLVKVMDTARSGPSGDLFPTISIGEVRKK